MYCPNDDYTTGSYYRDNSMNFTNSVTTSEEINAVEKNIKFIGINVKTAEGSEDFGGISISVLETA